MQRRASIPILAALALGGCSIGSLGGGTTPEPARTAATAPQSTAARAAPERQAPPTRLRDLMGANSARIDSLLGAPALVRREGPGELRLYRSSACVLHVIFYTGNEGVRATHIEARANNARLDAGGTEACVASFS